MQQLSSAKPTKSQRKQQSQRDKNRAKGQQSTSTAIVLRQQPKRDAKFRSVAPGQTIVSNKEYISDFSLTSNAFTTVQSFIIQPGSIASFPWLSSIAAQFEMYRFKSLKFSYTPTTNTNATGQVMLGVDYDVLDSLPTSKQQLKSYQGTVTVAPWQKGTLVCKLDNKFRYVQPYNQSGSGDARLNCVGWFIGASSYIQNPSVTTGPVGELQVEYEIELKMPDQTGPRPASFEVTNTNISQANALLTGSQISSSVPVQATGNSLLITQPGEYLVDFISTGSNISQLAGIGFDNTYPSYTSQNTLQVVQTIQTTTQAIQRAIIKIVVAAAIALGTGSNGVTGYKVVGSNFPYSYGG